MKIKTLLAASALASATMVAAPAPAAAQSDPLLGQMMAFGGNFCPRGWTAADGKLLAISQYQAVFSIMGTTYGGDGRTTFGMPDLRGRAPISQGQGPGLPDYRQGSKGGSVEFTLTQSQMPSHTHTGTVRASRDPADTSGPARNSFARTADGTNIYADTGNTTNNMAPNILNIDPAGGNLPVNKVSPYQAIQWCVALQGVFPSRN